MLTKAALSTFRVALAACALAVAVLAAPALASAATLAVTPTFYTAIHDQYGNTVTSVPAGSTVHDTATASSLLGPPQGIVAFTWYANGTCAGTGTDAGTKGTDLTGLADGSSTEGPLAPGDYSFSAHFTSNTTQWTDADSACESLHVSGAQVSGLTGSSDATPAYARTIGWDVTKSVDPPSRNVPAGGSATFDYTITVSHDDGADSDWEPYGTITVHNPNSAEVDGVTVTAAVDDPSGSCTVSDGSSTIPANSDVVFDYACPYSAPPAAANQTATATISWPAQTLSNFASLAAGTVSVDTPFTWGDPTLTLNGGVDIFDSLAGYVASADYTDPSPETFQYTYTFDDLPQGCDSYDNEVALRNDAAVLATSDAAVEICVGASDLTVTKTAKPSFTRTFGWTVSKSVDQTTQKVPAGGSATFNYKVDATKDAGTDSDWAVTGTITVTNPNSFDVDANLADTAPGADCTLDQTSVTVPANGSVDVGYSCAFADGSAGTNTATASWDAARYGTSDGSASGSADYSFDTPTKVVDDSVKVYDNGSPLGTTDQSKEFDYGKTLTASGGSCTPYDNTATVQDDTAVLATSNTVTVSVCGAGSDLTVAKTATPTFTRTFGWTVSKSVDQTSQKVAAGSNATFNYTVDVTKGAGTDSAWAVAGTITVTNPNPFDVVAHVADAAPGGTCSLDQSSVTVPANGSVPVGYSCTFAGGAAGTNTATVTWDKSAYGTPDGSASGTAGYSFDTPTKLVDDIVKVYDNGNLLGPTDHSTEFTYSKSFTAVAGKCTPYDNTATVQDDGGVLATSNKVTVTVCGTGSDLTVAKTATPTFTRTFGWTVSKSVDKTSQRIPAGGNATFNYTVGVTKDAGTDSAWAVAGTITVTNPNPFDVVANVADTAPGGTCSLGQTSVTVPAGGSANVGYSCTFASGAAGTNTATASWDSAAYGTPDGSASGTAGYSFSAPTKVVDDSVKVYDNGNLLGPTDHSTQFTYPKSLPATLGKCTPFDNTATVQDDTAVLATSNKVTVTVCGTGDLTVAKTATPTFTRTFGWTVSKSVDKTSQSIPAGGSATFNYAVGVTKSAGTDSAWAVTGTITVANPNPFDVVANVADAAPGGTCSLDKTSVTVPAGGSVPVGYSCTFASGAAGTNTATASWDSSAYGTADGSASGTAGFSFGSPTTVVNDSVGVYDNGSLLGTTNASKSFAYPKSFSGTAGTCTSYDNTATVQNGATTLATSSKVTVKVCVGKDLTAGATATPSFKRTYGWSIAKSVAQPTVTTPAGSSATFNYTVSVANAGTTDSGWSLAGTITITNPNDWEAITANVTDAVNNGGTCTVTNGTGVSVPAAGSVTRAYTCTYASAPSPAAGTDTVTVTWNASTYSTPHGSATGTASFTFATPTTEVNKTVTVKDTFNNATTQLGTVAYPGPGTFTYSRTVNAPTTGCTTYPNTATIVETGQQATASVQVCASGCGQKTGALTMGYWQNKNGQGLISGANQTQLLAYLKGYAPFADATAPLTTYTTNVINAASAGGSTMNPMLKAQMLATALDVYFSTPSLGGNKISAPAPIGGVKIDLKHVPPVGDASSAFGGAASMTVSQLLTYAAGQSNAGGSTWYGNVKSTQELAKDVFDAINNQNAATL